MLSTFRHAINNLQVQQMRLGHRMRGKPPNLAKTLQERLDELNHQDEIYTTRINIGFPKQKKSVSDIRRERMETVKKNKANKELEQLSRNHKLRIDLKTAREDWLEHLGPAHKQEIAKHYGVYEHLYGEGYFTPYLDLQVEYDLKNGSILPVCTGNVVKPTEASDLPSVSYKADEDSLWTLVLTNLDGHLADNDKEYVHWLVANIPGNNVEKGETLVDYLQPFPLRGTGYHRYVFVLYKQSQKMDYGFKNVKGASLDERTFVMREWYKNNQDHITPAGLAFFQSSWDVSVKKFFHDVLSMKEPVFEYDFPEPYIRPQEWYPRRVPFNLYMDRYRDPKEINKEYLMRKLKDKDPFEKPPKPLRFPNAHPLPKSMPSWLKLHEQKIRLNWGRVNDV